MTIPPPFAIYLYPTSWPSLIGGIYGVLCSISFIWLAIAYRIPGGKKCPPCGIVSIGLTIFPMYLYCAVAFWSAIYLLSEITDGSPFNTTYMIYTNQILNVIYILVIIGCGIFITIMENGKPGTVIATLSFAPIALPMIAMLSILLGAIIKVLIDYYPITLIILCSTIVPVGVIALILVLIRLKKSKNNDEKNSLIGLTIV